MGASCSLVATETVALRKIIGITISFCGRNDQKDDRAIELCSTSEAIALVNLTKLTIYDTEAK
ncbi:MAG: hypothetical protein ACOC1Z_02720 [Cyanobacteriota bacterium]